ncbi:MAG: TonB family protein [Granulosicoccaceae bacterium]
MSFALPFDISKLDTLTVALFAAAVLHALFILGVSFEPFLNELRTPATMEVILVQPTDSETPENANYLAQASQDGGGDTDEKVRPTTAFASDQDFQTDGIAPIPMEATSPEKQEASSEEILTTLFSDDLTNTDAENIEKENSQAKTDLILIEENLEIAKLSAAIEKQEEERAKRPKKKFLNAATKESSSAAYMYRWVERVERIGNLNYPDAIKRDKLSGALMMSVGIYKNGDVESVEILESSGFAVLDDAAKRIVNLSGPFEAMTGLLGREADILYITRTWEFQSSNSVISY